MALPGRWISSRLSSASEILFEKSAEARFDVVRANGDMAGL